MLNKSTLSVTIFSGALIALLFQFQNCAQAPAGEAVQTSNDEVRLIEEYNKTELSFVEPRTEVYDEAITVQVQGFCSRQQNGSEVRWALLSNQVGDGSIDQGKTYCTGGQFSLNLQLPEDMVCGLDHLVIVESAWGPSTQMVLVKRCQPLASVELPQGNLQRTCMLEYNLGQSLSTNRVCQKVCYAQDKLVLTENRPAEECRDLASTLAGH